MVEWHIPPLGNPIRVCLSIRKTFKRGFYADIVKTGNLSIKGIFLRNSGLQFTKLKKMERIQKICVNIVETLLRGDVILYTQNLLLSALLTRSSIRRITNNFPPKRDSGREKKDVRTGSSSRYTFYLPFIWRPHDAFHKFPLLYGCSRVFVMFLLALLIARTLLPGSSIYSLSSLSTAPYAVSIGRIYSVHTIAIDFILALPVAPEGDDCLMTVTCQASKAKLLIPGETTWDTERWGKALQFKLLENNWGVPSQIIFRRGQKTRVGTLESDVQGAQGELALQKRPLETAQWETWGFKKVATLERTSLLAISCHGISSMRTDS